MLIKKINVIRLQTSQLRDYNKIVKRLDQSHLSYNNTIQLKIGLSPNDLN